MQQLKIITATMIVALSIGSRAKADYLDTEGVIRSSNGQIVSVSFYEANGLDPKTGNKIKPDLCAQFGAHVPTAREIAMNIVSSGDGRIEEMSDEEETSGMTWSSSTSLSMRVFALNIDGTKDRFYFFPRYGSGYQDYVFWSSSRDAEPYFATPKAYSRRHHVLSVIPENADFQDVAQPFAIKCFPN